MRGPLFRLGRIEQRELLDLFQFLQQAAPDSVKRQTHSDAAGVPGASTTGPSLSANKPRVVRAPFAPVILARKSHRGFVFLRRLRISFAAPLFKSEWPLLRAMQDTQDFNSLPFDTVDSNER